MDRTQGWQTVDRHRARVADVLQSLTPEQWAGRSLCEAWTVKDVGAHLALAPTAGVGEVFGALLRARGNFDRAIAEASVRRSTARTTTEVVEDLRRLDGTRRLAPTTVWRDPLLDVLVHSQDIAVPLGIDLELPVDAAVEATEWAWRRRFPFFPARRLRGLTLVADDAGWRRGTGPEVHGPITALLLLSTGRVQAARPRLRGDGVALLDTRRPPRPSDHSDFGPS
jgi:uncharacterized protein (TIGR03083 family)